MKVLKVPEKNIVSKVIFSLKKGKVLVLPTDTVYGLVCNALNEKAVERIFEIKQRDKESPLGVFVRDFGMLESYAEMDSYKKKVLENYLPGKITFILKKKKDLAPGVGTKDSLGIRISDYALIKEIFERIDFPLAQTSANLSGDQSQTNIKEIIRIWKNKKNRPDLIINAGNLFQSLPSTVVDFTGEKPKILRQGEIEFSLKNL